MEQHPPPQLSYLPHYSSFCIFHRASNVFMVLWRENVCFFSHGHLWSDFWCSATRDQVLISVTHAVEINGASSPSIFQLAWKNDQRAPVPGHPLYNSMTVCLTNTRDSVLLVLNIKELYFNPIAKEENKTRINLPLNLDSFGHSCSRGYNNGYGHYCNTGWNLWIVWCLAHLVFHEEQ